MKKSDTLFRHKANLLYEVCGSIREMVNTITAKTNTGSVDMRAFKEMGVTTGMVGAWVNVEGCEGYWDLIAEVCREDKGGHIIIRTAEYGRNGMDMYDFSMDELIYLHDELEKIYKFVVKSK